MTDCAEALSLVEKLADEEATAAEKRAAESHLAQCSSCRSHLEFLVSLSNEARSMSFPEPPEAYWEHLPRRVLARIETGAGRPSRGRFFRFLLAPAMLRWGALGATFLVLASVGISVFREDSRTVAPPSPAAATETPQPEVRVAVEEPGAPPPMARDEAASEPAKQESKVVSGEDDRAAAEAMPAAAAPSESASAFSAGEGSRAPDPRKLEKQNALTLESATRPRAAPAPATLARGAALGNCEELRRAADSVHDGPQRAEARYHLATCSLERHEREPTEELRKLAIEDAEAFLAVEGAGPRADEIRERLDRARR